MALTSTLFTGLSGINVNQARLQVIGNNIANVNSVAFKSSRALFKPQFYLTDRAGTPPDAEFGGTNPSQRGLGAQVAVIEKNLAQGVLETTGRGTDMAVDGEGYFIVRGDDTFYTRDGSFSLSEDRMLVNQNGMFVQGFEADETGEIVRGNLTDLSIPIGQLTVAEATENALLKGNLNADGEISSGATVSNSQELFDAVGAAPTGATLLTDLRNGGALATPIFAAGETLTVNAKRGDGSVGAMNLEIDAATTLADLNTFLQQAMAIDTTIAGPVGSVYETPGVSLAAGAGGGALINVVGNTGASNAISLSGAAISYSGGASPVVFGDTPDSNPAGEGIQTRTRVYDSLGTPVDLNITIQLDSKDSEGTNWRWYATSADDTNATTFDPTSDGPVIGSGVLEFDTNGKFLQASNSTVEIQRANTGAASPLRVNVDFSNITSFTRTNSNVLMEVQDGQPAGDLTDFSVGVDGVITGNFSNGQSRVLGQVALATFDNALGLEDEGGNIFRAGAASGQAVLTAPLELAAGGIRSNTLEMSNVDLSKEFIDMIITSTGYTAASRVISTSDRLLQELLNVSR